MRTLIRTAVLALGLLPGFAHAQSSAFPQTLPPNTLVGRLGINAGPTQAIPFATFFANQPLASGKMWIGSAGNLAAPQTPTGDLAVSTGGVFTLASVNVTTGVFGSATQCVTVTSNAKGLTTAISAATCAPAVGSITGLGTGIAAALAINTGSAGAPVLFNGAGGTPTSIVLTNGTGTAAGLTAGAVTTNANLTGDVTSVGNATTLTNAPVIAKVLTGYASGAGTVSSADSILSAFQKINGNDALKAPLASPTFTGTPAAPTAAVDTNTTQLATTAMVLAQSASATPGATAYTAAVGTSTRYARGDHTHAVSLTSVTNSLGGIVSMNNTANFFDGPSVAQGTSGTWLASGTVTVYDTGGGALILCKLWDGTTIIASSGISTFAANNLGPIALSGVITSPAANIRISCQDGTAITGKISATDAGAKSSTITAIRLAP